MTLIERDLQMRLNIRQPPSRQIPIQHWEDVYYEYQHEIDKMQDMKMMHEGDVVDYGLTILASDTGFYFELRNFKTNKIECMRRRYYYSTQLRTSYHAIYFGLELIEKENIDGRTVNMQVSANEQVRNQCENYVSRFISKNKLVPSLANNRQNLDLIILILLHQNIRYRFRALRADEYEQRFRVALNMDLQDPTKWYLDVGIRPPAEFDYERYREHQAKPEPSTQQHGPPEPPADNVAPPIVETEPPVSAPEESKQVQYTILIKDTLTEAQLKKILQALLTNCDSFEILQRK